MGIWCTGSDDVGLIQSTKAPKHHQSSGPNIWGIRGSSSYELDHLIPLWAYRGRLGVLVCARARAQMGIPPTPHLRTTLLPFTASRLHCTAGSSRSFTAIRKNAGLCCGSRLRRGEVFAYVGRNHNLKDLIVASFPPKIWEIDFCDCLASDLG